MSVITAPKIQQVWLTGASGFLGAKLLKGIDPARYRVISFSRSSGVPDRSLDLAGGDAAERLQEIAIRDVPPDIVVHLAALKPSSATLYNYVRDNVLSTANLLDALANLPPCHLVMISTLSVYGAPLRNPVRPEDPAQPFHPYATTKLAAEHLALGAEKARSRTVVRLPSLYGVGQSDSFIDGLAKRALQGGPLELFGNGESVRDALHVTDAVRAILGAVETLTDGTRRLVNVGCGQPITVKEWASALVAALGVSVEIVPVNTPPTQAFDLYADNTLAHREFGFRPMSLTQAMGEFADELRSER